MKLKRFQESRRNGPVIVVFDVPLLFSCVTKSPFFALILILLTYIEANSISHSELYLLHKRGSRTTSEEGGSG